MKKIFTGILVCFSAISFANVEVNGPLDNKMFNKEVNENKSYYETLGEMFQTGSKPDKSKLIGGLWSGRCFKKSKPYEPLNGAYHFRKKRNDAGPLGEVNIVYEASSFWAPSESPSYFDGRDESEVPLESYSRVFEKDDSIAMKFNLSSETVLSLVKFSGKYLIEELFSSEISNVGSLENNKSVPSTRCYYFIPEYAR